MEPLYKLDQEIRSLISSADPLTGEIDLQALSDLQMSREEKQNNIVLFVKGAEMQEEMIDAEIVRLKQMKEGMGRKVEWLKNYLMGSMLENEETELTFGVHSVKLRSNPPSVVIYNEDTIPNDFKHAVISTKIDKIGIKKAIQEGKEVEGAELVHTRRIDIK